MLHTIRPTWENVWAMAAVLTFAGIVLSYAGNRWLRAAAPFCREGAVIGFLYGLWQLAAKISIRDVPGAFSRARWIQDTEHDLHIPSELSTQKLVLGHRLIVEGANLYYASAHLTLMLVFLGWLFWRHRQAYPHVRNVMALTTLLCLIVQLMPVAPPRMLPDFVDTAWYYGQSVYAGGLPFDQLSAMPSVHVAWSVLIGYYVWKVSPSRWRFVGPLHAVVTIVVVVVTANHWWADGIVAVALLVVAAWVAAGGGLLWTRWRADRTATAVAATEAPGVPAMAGEADPA